MIAGPVARVAAEMDRAEEEVLRTVFGRPPRAVSVKDAIGEMAAAGGGQLAGRADHRLLRVAALGGLLVLWEALTRIGWIPALFLPSPVGVIRELTHGAETDPEMRDAVIAATGVLARLGAAVDDVSLPLLPSAGAAFSCASLSASSAKSCSSAVVAASA